MWKTWHIKTMYAYHDLKHFYIVFKEFKKLLGKKGKPAQYHL
jgi:hypothetical protein